MHWLHMLPGVLPFSILYIYLLSAPLAHFHCRWPYALSITTMSQSQHFVALKFPLTKKLVQYLYRSPKKVPRVREDNSQIVFSSKESLEWYLAKLLFEFLLPSETPWTGDLCSCFFFFFFWREVIWAYGYKGIRVYHDSSSGHSDRSRRLKDYIFNSKHKPKRASQK